MKRLLLLLAFLGAASAANAQVVLTEDFDGGAWPPAGWTVVDNTGSGSWNTSSAFTHGNLAGTGECAAIDSDNYGIGLNIDGELITPAFTVPATGYFALEFNHDFNYFGGETADVDLRVGGGAWTNLVSFVSGRSGLETLPLDNYSGSSVEVRFRYYNANYDWWWHVDDVIVHDIPVPPVPIWLEDFDSGAWPPAGWTVVDNTPTLTGSWNTSSAFTHGNLAGLGECAAIDSDDYLFRDVDGELISPPFSIPATGANLEFDHHFLYYSGGGQEICDVDLRVGGGTWTNLASWTLTATGHEVIDLGAYAGATNVEVRFHYYNANYDWYWHVDNVALYHYTAMGPGTSYCPGDGVSPHTLCPCANNNNGLMGGCDWGDLAFPAGGVLGATGSDSLAANDTLLVATGVSNNFGIFFGANNQVNSGNGNPLNDGLRCAGGGLVRLIPPTIASGNQLMLPGPVQTLDTGAVSGATRRYQYWFRTPAGPCGQMANLTNGYEIAWMP